MSTDFGRRAFNYTALLQDGTPFLSLLKSVLPYMFQASLKVLLYSPAHTQLTHSV